MVIYSQDLGYCSTKLLLAFECEPGLSQTSCFKLQAFQTHKRANNPDNVSQLQTVKPLLINKVQLYREVKCNWGYCPFSVYLSLFLVWSWDYCHIYLSSDQQSQTCSLCALWFCKVGFLLAHTPEKCACIYKWLINNVSLSGVKVLLFFVQFSASCHVLFKITSWMTTSVYEAKHSSPYMLHNGGAHTGHFTVQSSTYIINYWAECICLRILLITAA